MSVHDSWLAGGRRLLTTATAVVLAGGLGTRLRRAVADRPKVLAPVSGRPFLSYLLDRLQGAGVQRAVLCVGYLGEMVMDHFGREHHGRGLPGRLEIAYSREEELLGTGGALRLALDEARSETLIVLNGDSCFDTELDAFAAAHLESGAATSLALAHLDDTRRFGRVELGVNQQIERFEEKGATGGPGWINAGIYLIERAVALEIAVGQVMSLERDVFPLWAGEGRLCGHRATGAFLDIGTPESYARAESFLAEAREEVFA